MREKAGGNTHDNDDPTLDQDVNWRQVEQRLYEPDQGGGLTTTIVYALAAAEDISPIELTSPPLYETVDVAAIEDAFFGFGREADRQGTGNVEFRYTEYLVKVRSDGWVQIYEQTVPKLS